MILTIEEFERLVENALSNLAEYNSDDDYQPLGAKARQMLEDMRKPITRENLLAAGWKAFYLDIEYVYGQSIGTVVASPSVGAHLFYLRWDRDDPNIVREIGCIEDTGQFDDETVHATGISNMYELMEWVRSTGERA